MQPGLTGRTATAWHWGAITALLFIQAWIRFGSSLNHDSSWYLHVAEQMDAGKKLYADLIEVNPPLGIWLTRPLVSIAKLTGWSDVHVTYGLVFSLIALSLWLCNSLFRLANFSERSRRLWLLVLAFAVLFLPGPDFAEREHLLVALFVPWLLLRALPPETHRASPGLRIAIGFCAAIAVSLKPQSLLAVIAVELFLVYKQRSISRVLAIENLAALTLGIAYAIAVLLLAPEFLTSMVKLGGAAYYPYYGYPAWVIAINIGTAVIALALALVSLTGLGEPERRLVQVTMAASAGFILSYVIQNKGFAYQALPATILAFCALSFSLLASSAKPDKATLLRLGVLALVTFAMLPAQQRYTPRDAVLRQALKGYAPEATSVFIASTRVSDAFPAVRELGLRWASSLPTQWLAPYVEAHAGQSNDGNDPIINLARTTTTSDLQGQPPDLILIDESEDQMFIPGGRFDYVNFWSSDPGFAEFWKGYDRRGKIENFAVYTRKK